MMATVSGKFISERVFSVSDRRKILAATNLKWWRVGNSCDTMADNTGHGLISTGNRTADPML
jgi:hypothetical protein